MPPRRARAGADGDDFAFLRLFLGGVGDDDAAGGLFFGLDTADQHAIVQRSEFHGIAHLGSMNGLVGTHDVRVLTPGAYGETAPARQPPARLRFDVALVVPEHRPGGVAKAMQSEGNDPMKFVRGAWRFLVGVKDALVLLLLLVFFVGLWAALHTRGAGSVPDGSALVLDLNGPVVDQASEQSPFGAVTGTPNNGSEIEVRDVIRAIDTARTDSRIKLIVLQLDTFLGAGQANLQAIGASLQAFKKSGKPVYAYATAYTDASYYLAAHATKAWINPMGGVLLNGPGGTNLYFKKALDKLDVDVNIFRVGKYKSFVEPFTRTEASPEAKAAEQALVDGVWKTYVDDVRAVRPAVDIAADFANLPARVAAAQRRFRAGGDRHPPRRHGRHAGRVRPGGRRDRRRRRRQAAGRVQRDRLHANMSPRPSRTGAGRRSASSMSPATSSTARRGRARPVATRSPG